MTRKILFYLCVLCVCFWAGAAAQLSAAPRSYSSMVSGLSPMQTRGMEPNVASILDNYFEKTFGGEENWSKINSIRLSGERVSDDATIGFTALAKKPDLLKTTVTFEDGTKLVMAYDGEDAWKMIASRPDLPVIEMEGDEAAEFIHGTALGGYLLYPTLKGKTIKLNGIAMVDDHRCYELELTLPNGKQSLHLLDQDEFIERRTVTINQDTGFQVTSTHGDFRELGGAIFAFSSEVEIEGKISHRVQLENVDINVGIPSWAFTKPD